MFSIASVTATSEHSLLTTMTEQDVSKSADREPGAKTGQGISRKAKRVEKNKIDFK